MSEIRVSVEWIFGDVINYFKFLNFKKKLENKFKCMWHVPFFTMLVVVAMDPPHLITLMFLPQKLMIISTEAAKNIKQEQNDNFPLEN